MGREYRSGAGGTERDVGNEAGPGGSSRIIQGLVSQEFWS